MAELEATIWLITIGVLAILVWPLRNKPRRGLKAEIRRPSSPYQAVTITANLGSCLSAWKLRGRRYLANEAPPLPLPWCDMETCNCKYRYHADRRAGDDRRSRHGSLNKDLEQSGVYKPRHGDDRRKPAHTQEQPVTLPPESTAS